MSIPNEFRPVKGAVTELPYVQPVMTGYDTWSNEPSFGLRVSANRDNYGAAWQALDGDSSTGWGTNTHTSARITLDFERELTLLGIDMIAWYGGSSHMFQRIVLLANSAPIIDLQNVPYGNIRMLPITPTPCSKIVIELTPEVASGSKGGIYDLNITATYKP